MRLRHTISLLAAAATLAAPATAVAQSAGDDQYSDPFAGDNGSSDGGGSGGSDGGDSGGSSGGSSGGDSSSSGGGSSSGAEASTSGPTAASADDGPSLARTGAETGILALGGVSLVLAGIALRLRLRESADRA